MNFFLIACAGKLHTRREISTRKLCVSCRFIKISVWSTRHLLSELVFVVVLFGITQIFAYQQDLKMDAMEAELDADSAVD